MKIKTTAAPAKPTRSDFVAALAFDGRAPKPPAAFADAVKAAKATGDLGTDFRAVSLFHPAKGPAKRLVFIGMGKIKDLDAERLRRAAALAQERAEGVEVAEMQLWLSPDDHKGLDAETAGAAIAEGLVLGAYRYEPPRKEKPKARKAQRAHVVYDGDQKAFARGIKLGAAGGEATNVARDLANASGDRCTPKYLAAQAKKLGSQNTAIKVLEERDMARLKMGALLGVSRGSVEPAKLILMDHKPAGAKATICVVGKGLTFDSGGISIKPPGKMDEMRYDMCGGAAVLGLFAAIKSGALQGSRRKLRVVGVVAASENMPSGDAQKPGDVVTACDGTTIEVLNTDAEGRLILSDAMAYAKKTYKPDMMVDLATLTGAVIMALGHDATGIMGNDQKVIDALIEAGEAAGEPCWQLPLWDVHRDMMKSKFADLQNINAPGQGAGSTAGGAFLAHFAGDTPWAHMDIAGTAWGQRARDYHRWGGSGTAVRTLVHWLRNA